MLSPCSNDTDDTADTTQYLEKRVLVQLNGSRKVMGILRGYDVRRRRPYSPEGDRSSLTNAGVPEHCAG